MHEIRYRKGDEWFTVEYTPHVEMIHGKETTDPSYTLGVGATFKPPKDAEEVYVFYHFDDGEEADENQTCAESP